MSKPGLDQITTIVVVMLENRSFDHMLGYLAMEAKWNGIEGVKPKDPAWLQKATNTYLGNTYPPFLQKDLAGPLAADPPHEFGDIARQMGQQVGGTFPMGGFVENYANAKGSPRITKKPPVMGYFSGDQLRVTDRLARNFAICDHWFSSLPAGTQANRLMCMAGYSLLAQNTVPLPNHTLVYDWLDERKVRWRVYHEELPFFAMMPNQIGRIVASGNFKPLADLVDDVNNESPDEFPEVVFIEPSYTDAPHLGSTRDDHAPSSALGGQQFLNEVYRSIRVSPRFDSTVMVITYDEHGGFFDHVSPPLIATPPPESSHTNPGFQSLGIRVPALVISPLVSAGHYYSGILDHTSILKFIGQKFGTRNGQPPGYSLAVDSRPVGSVYDVLNLATPRDENFVTAIPAADQYIQPETEAVGYLPDNRTPPTTLSAAFKFGLDTVGRQAGAKKSLCRFARRISARPRHPPRMKVLLRSVAVLGAIFLVGCAGTIQPSRQDPADYSRLEAAVESCDLVKTQALVAADPQLVNKAGWGKLTPLHLAAQNRCGDVAKLLVDKGAQVDARADGDTTPLHLAAQKGSIEVASVLLAAGASINATDAKHRTALARATAWRQPKMVEFLRQHGGK